MPDPKADPSAGHLIEHFRLRANALGKLLPAHQGPGAPTLPRGSAIGDLNRAGMLPGRILEDER
jgi:hypothetical protein